MQPPPGYDDQSVIPRKQLKFLLGEFEGELIRIEKVYKQHVPSSEVKADTLENQFLKIRHSVEELGSDYTMLVEKLFSEYKNFREKPDKETLEKLFNEVRSLQLMLA